MHSSSRGLWEGEDSDVAEEPKEAGVQHGGNPDYIAPEVLLKRWVEALWGGEMKTSFLFPSF